MERKASGILSELATLLTAATILASVILLIMYGKIEVIKDSSYGFGSSVEKIINWPLIVSLIFGVLYAFLFAGIAIQTNRTHNRIVDIHNKLKANQPDEE